MNYTKGSWSAYFGHDGQFKDHPYILCRLEGRGEPEPVIAECVYRKEENQANAHLIAAAPELYETLKSLNQTLNSMSETWKRIFLHSDPIIDKIKKALAKAEGS